MIINGMDEYIREGPDPSEPISYHPHYRPPSLEQVYHEPSAQSEFMTGFEDVLDNCAAVACLLIFGPFLLMLGLMSLPILIPYSIFYLIKRATR